MTGSAGSPFHTVAVVSPGDMGHAVGRTLGAQGFRVVTALQGRGEGSRARAARAGMTDLGTLDALVGEADVVLSILPPAAAPGLADEMAAAIERTGRTPLYVDCNAISPETMAGIAERLCKAGASVVDVGIVGPAPGKGRAPRFYASGPEADRLTALSGPELEVRPVGPEIGTASAIKMCYAGLTKGSWTLWTAVLLGADSLGVRDELLAEFSHSQAGELERMRRMVPWLAADAGRWIGEMEEIAATFRSAGVTDGFHEGAAEIFRLLARSELAGETRETLDQSRTLEQAITAFRQKPNRAAE